MQVELGLSPARWRAALRELAPSDVYFTHELHALHEANGEGIAFACLARDGERLLFVPGIRSQIPEAPGLSDVQSCNGYAGPLSSTEDPAFLAMAWQALRAELAAAGVVSVFLRLHPLLENARLLPDWARLRADRPMVYVPLDAGREAAFAAADSRHRNMVRKARREGVEVLWNAPGCWERFQALYVAAMDRLDAPDRLRFGPAMFEGLAAQPWAEVAEVGGGGRTLSAAVFLFGERWAHYQFAARDPGAGNHLASAVLDAALDRAFERGLLGLHTGGGRTTAPDDALLRFKRSLGGRLVDYQVALCVTDEAAYERLVAEWTAAAGRAPVWLTGYREPRPA
jgi:hypothetical protein